MAPCLSSTVTARIAFASMTLSLSQTSRQAIDTIDAGGSGDEDHDVANVLVTRMSDMSLLAEMTVAAEVASGGSGEISTPTKGKAKLMWLPPAAGSGSADTVFAKDPATTGSGESTFEIGCLNFSDTQSLAEGDLVMLFPTMCVGFVAARIC
jgi:hypothetical protein